MEPFTTAALLGAAGTIGASGLGVLGQYSANSKNMKIARAQNQWNLDMWNRANAYNHPSAQMQRLIDAGLNPRMIYGSGNVSGNVSGQIPKAEGATMQNIASNLPNTLSMLGEYMGMKNLGAQNDAIRQGIELKKQETINKSIESSILGTKKLAKELDYNQKKELYNTQVALQKKLLEMNSAKLKKDLFELKELLPLQKRLGVAEADQMEKLRQYGINTNDPAMIKMFWSLIENFRSFNEKNKTKIKIPLVR